MSSRDVHCLGMTTSCTYDVEVHGRVFVSHFEGTTIPTHIMTIYSARTGLLNHTSGTNDHGPTSSEGTPTTRTQGNLQEGLFSNIDGNINHVDVHTDEAATYVNYDISNNYWKLVNK